MDRKLTFQDIPSLLHSSLFAFEKAHGRLTGSTSKAILQLIVKELPKILQKDGHYVIDKRLNIEKNMEQFRDYLDNREYFENVKFERFNDTFIFELEGCVFAKSGVHETLEPEKSTCPFATIAAAIIFYLTKKNMTIGDSEFNKTGTKTVMKLVR